MKVLNEGLTDTYNRFHDPDETAEAIQKLRQLHVEMDKAVAGVYGWTGLDLGHGFHETKQGVRFTISGPARREVLARLLKLNHERYAEEVAQGLHEKKGRAKETAKGTVGKRGRQSKKTDPAQKTLAGLGDANDVWYFAYGSNLWIDQKTERTGPIRQGDQRPRIARLSNYRLAFNKRGKGGVVCANVVDSPSAEVLGVIYLCDSQSMDTMDAWEIGYQRKMVKVTAENGEVFDAVTYVAKPESLGPEGQPSDDYLGTILKGARAHGLPEEYIKSIEELAGHGG